MDKIQKAHKKEIEEAQRASKLIWCMLHFLH
jgi:hypothetical protein